MLSLLFKYLSSFVKFIIFSFAFVHVVHANQSFPVMWNLQNSDEYFIGRTEFLKSMHEYLFEKDNCLIISGLPGFGQTQVIKRYAELNKENYDIVWRFDASKNLSEQYINFAKRWNKVIKKYYKDDSEQNLLHINLDLINTDIIEEQVHYRLKVTKLNWLIIFDNVSNYSDILSNLPKKYNSNGYGHLIISATNAASYSAAKNVMILDKLKREESVELLLKTTGEIDHVNANLLAETLQDHPLAVARAGSFIEFYKSISIAEYNRLFLTERKKLWEKEKQFITQDNNNSYKINVFTTLSLIIDAVKKESPMAYDLLTMIAFVDCKNIPETLLLQYIRSNYNKEYNYLDFDFKDALSVLLKYSLITRNFPNKNTETNKLRKETLFTVHGLTQLVIQDLLNEEEKRFYLNRSIVAINNLLPNNIHLLMKSLSKAFYVKPHINILSKHAKDLKLYNSEVMQLELRLLEYNLSGIRNDKEVEGLINRVEHINKKIQKINQDQKTFLKIRLAIMKSAFFAWVKAEYLPALKEALYAYDLIKTLSSPYHYNDEYLMIYNRLARLYSVIGDNTNAFKYAYLGKEIIDNNSNNLLEYKNDFLKILVKVYIDKGDYHQALEYSNLALNKLDYNSAIGEVSLGDIAAYLINADILIRMERYEEAMQKVRLLNDIAKKFLPNEHSLYKAHIMSFYGYLSALLELENNLEQNIYKLISSQKTLKELLGEENYYKNCNVYLGHKFLGELYEKQGNNLRARQEYSIGLKILANTYISADDVATDDLSDLYCKLAIINLKLGLPSKAIDYIDSHYHIFGLDHPRSIKITEYLTDNNVELGF